MKHLLALALSLSAITAQGITLNWAADTDPSIVGYNIYLGPAPGKEVLFKHIVGKVNSYTFPPQPTGAYFAYIAAYNSAGYIGLISNEVEWYLNAYPTPAANKTLSVSLVDPTPTPTPTPTPIPTPTPKPTP